MKTPPLLRSHHLLSSGSACWLVGTSRIRAFWPRELGWMPYGALRRPPTRGRPPLVCSQRLFVIIIIIIIIIVVVFLLGNQFPTIPKARIHSRRLLVSSETRKTKMHLVTPRFPNTHDDTGFWHLLTRTQFFNGWEQYSFSAREATDLAYFRKLDGAIGARIYTVKEKKYSQVGVKCLSSSDPPLGSFFYTGPSECSFYSGFPELLRGASALLFAVFHSGWPELERGVSGALFPVFLLQRSFCVASLDYFLLFFHSAWPEFHNTLNRGQVKRKAFVQKSLVGICFRLFTVIRMHVI